MSLNKQQQGWARSVAAEAGYDYAVIAALIDKESDGKFYWNVGGKNLPALNIEGHYFYKYLTLYAPEKLKQAVADGLAAKKARGIKVPSSYAGRYEFFERMKAVHREAAYMSVSAGVGQIMGDNYKNMCFAKQCLSNIDTHAMSPVHPSVQPVGMPLATRSAKQRAHGYVSCSSRTCMRLCIPFDAHGLHASFHTKGTAGHSPASVSGSFGTRPINPKSPSLYGITKARVIGIGLIMYTSLY